MSRAVTADHVLFDEAITAFHPNTSSVVPSREAPNHSYLLADFYLSKQWHLPDCTVQPAIQARLPGPYSAFICRVDNPPWCDSHNPHLYGIALASVVSFVLGRPCKSTRDGYLCRKDTLTEDETGQLSILYPVLAAGPGCTNVLVAPTTLEKYESEVAGVISRLRSVPYPKYVVLMQAIRLAHLSLLSKRDDFGLAYLLIVAAIESVAQSAIKREKVKRHPSETAWERHAKNDQEFSELLRAYRAERGNNQHLKERYVRFIKEHAPVAVWDEVVPPPHKDMADYVKYVAPTHNIDWILEKQWFEKYPSDLSEEAITEILSTSYTHRSSFIHRGVQPPHDHPIAFNRFFQEHSEIDGTSVAVRLLPNYELLFGIAQYSIRRWMDSL